MIKKELSTGYELTADEGKELVVIFEGEEIARTKHVFIPTDGTVHEWVEVPEKIIEVQTVVDTSKTDKIAELERLLAELISE